jgi:hypothetical protein
VGPMAGRTPCTLTAGTTCPSGQLHRERYQWRSVARVRRRRPWAPVVSGQCVARKHNEMEVVVSTISDNLDHIEEPRRN